MISERQLSDLSIPHIIFFNFREDTYPAYQFLIIHVKNGLDPPCVNTELF